MFIVQATGNLVVVKLLRLFLTQGAVLAMCAKVVELKLKFTQ
jgi:hypothetical protein